MEPDVTKPEPDESPNLTPASEPTVPPVTPPTPNPAPAPAPAPESPPSTAPPEPTPVAEPTPTPASPEEPTTSATPPSIVVGGDAPEDASVTPLNQAELKAAIVVSKRSKKPLVISLIFAVLVLGGAAAYYFGYYMNPGLIYSQALTNTGKGYTKLADYIDAQSKLKYKGTTADGAYTFGEGSVATDGKLSLKSDGQNAEATVDVNTGATRLGFDVRAIKSSTSTPNIYFKASGLNGLQSLLGDSGLGSSALKFDNKWITVDQSVIQKLQASADSVTGGSSGSAMSSPTQAQVSDEMHAFGRVNQQYIFTADKSKAVTTVVKKFGTETVDGHKTYHYRVALVKDNVKKYITAQRDALKASQLDTWIKQNKYDNYVDLGYDSLEQSADNIKSTDTFDVWADVSQRIIYKVRVADPKQPADNYVDIGLNYTGGDDYPFFVNGHTKDGGDVTTGSLTATLNTKSNGVALNAQIKGSGSSAFTFKANLNVKPTNDSATVATPTGAEPLTQALNELGLGPLLDSLLQDTSALNVPATASTPSTTTRIE